MIGKYVKLTVPINKISIGTITIIVDKFNTNSILIKLIKCFWSKSIRTTTKGKIMNIIKELDEEIKDSGHTSADIKWITLSYGNYNIPIIKLPPTESIAGYSKAKKLYKDIDYDDGYGGQELDGIVVFYDNSWLERWENDGSEDWEFKQTPQIKDYKDNKWNH